MKKLILLASIILAGSLFSANIWAADEKTGTAKNSSKQKMTKKGKGEADVLAAPKQQAKTNNNVGTNVIGTQEAPTVMNIVPWKDREVKMEKKEATSAVLSQVLKPLDRDELMREVQYFDLLEQSRQ